MNGTPFLTCPSLPRRLGIQRCWIMCRLLSGTRNSHKTLKLIEESIFDQHGEYKDSTTPDLTKEDQILDVETPTDDPNYKAPIETSKSDMRVYLHNLIKDETIPEYRIFFVGRQVLEDRHRPQSGPSHQTSSLGPVSEGQTLASRSSLSHRTPCKTQGPKEDKHPSPPG